MQAVTKDIPAAVSARAAQLIQMNKSLFDSQRLRSPTDNYSVQVSFLPVVRILRVANYDVFLLCLQGTVQVFIKNLVGNTVTILADLDWPTWYVKKCIEDKEGVPASEMRLIFSGRQLGNIPTLREHQVQKESTLHMYLPCRGD